MGRGLMAIFVSALALSPAVAEQRMIVAQLNCDMAGRLSAQARQAACLHEYERALDLMRQVKSAPRQCREPDERLDSYIVNISRLVALQQAGGPPTPCRPIQTGSTSYACEGPSTPLSEQQRKM